MPSTVLAPLHVCIIYSSQLYWYCHWPHFLHNKNEAQTSNLWNIMWLGGRARIPPQAVSLWKPALKFPVLWLLIYSPVLPSKLQSPPSSSAERHDELSPSTWRGRSAQVLICTRILPVLGIIKCGNIGSFFPILAFSR